MIDIWLGVLGTCTTYPETHLKFLGFRLPLTSTFPNKPVLPLRSASTSNKLRITEATYPHD